MRKTGPLRIMGQMSVENIFYSLYGPSSWPRPRPPAAPAWPAGDARARCRLITVGTKQPVRLMRFCLFFADGPPRAGAADGDDPIAWFERGLPLGGFRLSTLVGKVSLNLELCV